MKNLKYISLWFLLGMFLASCIDDKGNYDYKNPDDVFSVTVSGLEDRTIVLLQPTNMTPVINGQVQGREYEYSWYMYQGNSLTIHLSDERNLTDFIFTQPAGEYNLFFAVKDVQTDITHFSEITVNLVSPFYNGYVVLKDTGDGGDIDFMSRDEDGVTPDLIKTVNGERLAGDPRFVGFQLTKYNHQEKDENGEFQYAHRNAAVLYLLSDEDILVVEDSGMEILKHFNDVFINPPANIDPVYFGYGLANPFSPGVTLINDGKIYQYDDMYDNAFGVYGFPLNAPWGSDYYLHHEVVAPVNPFQHYIVWETTKKDFLQAMSGQAMSSATWNYSTQKPSSIRFAMMRDLGYELVMYPPGDGNVGTPYGFALFHCPDYNEIDWDNLEWTDFDWYVAPEEDEDPDDPIDISEFSEYVLIRIRGGYNGGINTYYTVPSGSGLFGSQVYAAHSSSEYLYYSDGGNKLYSYFVTSQTDGELAGLGISRETEEYTFPSGETIACIKHLFISSTESLMVVLTNSSSGWKLYQFTMTGATKDFDKTNYKTWSGEGQGVNFLLKP